MSGHLLLHTIVPSELVREQPAPVLLDSFGHNVQSAMHINTVNQAEILLAAAKTYAVIVAARTRLDQLISTESAQIAAAWLTVATRDIRDFDWYRRPYAGQTLVN